LDDWLDKHHDKDRVILNSSVKGSVYTFQAAHSIFIVSQLPRCVRRGSPNIPQISGEIQIGNRRLSDCHIDVLVPLYGHFRLVKDLAGDLSNPKGVVYEFPPDHPAEGNFSITSNDHHQVFISYDITTTFTPGVVYTEKLKNLFLLPYVCTYLRSLFYSHVPSRTIPKDSPPEQQLAEVAS
jgi:hypothetical protein